MAEGTSHLLLTLTKAISANAASSGGGWSRRAAVGVAFWSLSRKRAAPQNCRCLNRSGDSAILTTSQPTR